MDDDMTPQEKLQMIRHDRDIRKQREAEKDAVHENKSLRKRISELEKHEGEDRAVLKSLLVELWDGVRMHGLKAPKHGRDGERLIHAYCGAIAELRNKVSEVESREQSAREGIRELLKFGQHDGECSGPPYDACQQHLDASEKRKKVARSFLSAKNRTEKP